MPNYRRAFSPGGTFFFTVVTYRRTRLFDKPEFRALLRNVIQRVRRNYPFSIDAWVLLPEHLHCIWTLPQGDADFSKRWSLIKSGFSRQAKAIQYPMEPISPSRQKHRESAFWQRRFWEHLIRDDADFEAHIDYIHFNPVKHGWVNRAEDWPHSTIHRNIKKGFHPENWALEASKGGQNPATDRHYWHGFHRDFAHHAMPEITGHGGQNADANRVHVTPRRHFAHPTF